MKTWLKILNIALAVMLAVSAILLFKQEEACCICNSLRYHAPCLVDLETGELVELDLYFPHPTKVAELAEPQPQMCTFSFVHLGSITGTKLTDRKIIEIDIPISEKTANPALCQECRKQVGGTFVGRYVLADLYDKDEKTLILISADLSMVLRCYKISATEKESGILNVVIQGVLE